MMLWGVFVNSMESLFSATFSLKAADRHMHIALFPRLDLEDNKPNATNTNHTIIMSTTKRVFLLTGATGAIGGQIAAKIAAA